MCEQEYYLPLRIKPSSEHHCHRTCKGLYSVDDDACNGGGRLYFCTFCDHTRVEESPTGELMRPEFCKQYTSEV